MASSSAAAAAATTAALAAAARVARWWWGWVGGLGGGGWAKGVNVAGKTFKARHAAAADKALLLLSFRTADREPPRSGRRFAIRPLGSGHLAFFSLLLCVCESVGVGGWWAFFFFSTSGASLLSFSLSLSLSLFPSRLILILLVLTFKNEDGRARPASRAAKTETKMAAPPGAQRPLGPPFLRRFGSSFRTECSAAAVIVSTPIGPHSFRASVRHRR